jgi:hypothetical protein
MVLTSPQATSKHTVDVDRLIGNDDLAARVILQPASHVEHHAVNNQQHFPGAVPLHLEGKDTILTPTWQESKDRKAQILDLP